MTAHHGQTRGTGIFYKRFFSRVSGAIQNIVRNSAATDQVQNLGIIFAVHFRITDIGKHIGKQIFPGLQKNAAVNQRTAPQTCSANGIHSVTGNPFHHAGITIHGHPAGRRVHLAQPGSSAVTLRQIRYGWKALRTGVIPTLAALD